MRTRRSTRLRHQMRVASRAVGLLGLMLLLIAPLARAVEPGTVVVLPTTGVVDQVMAGYLQDSITQAAADGAPAVVIELDTPGRLAGGDP